MSEAAIEVESRSVGLDEDPFHIVCHCTDDNVAWCGLSLKDEAEWADDDDPDCPLCGLVYEELDAAEVCPWGCGCCECSGLEPTP